MRQEDLLDAIGSVKEERLARTEKKKSARKTWLRIGSVAAGLAVCVIAVSALSSLPLFSIGNSANSADSATPGVYQEEENFNMNDSDTPEEAYEYMGGLFTENGDPEYPVSADNTGAYASEDVSDSPEAAEKTDASSEDSQVSSRKLITTMYLTIEAEEYDSAISWIEQQTSALGGYVQSTDTYTRYQGLHYASYTLRIPAASLSAFAEGMGSIGNITSSSSETQDITLTYVDIQSHVQSLKVEQERLMELLEQAESLSDMLDIEDRLSSVRYELESYQSRLLLYDNQVTYSTLYLEVYEVSAYTEPEPVTFAQRVQTGFSRNLTALSETATDLLVFLLSSLPTILVVGVIIGAVIAIVWKIRQKWQNS